MSGRIWPSAAR